MSCTSRIDPEIAPIWDTSSIFLGLAVASSGQPASLPLAGPAGPYTPARPGVRAVLPCMPRSKSVNRPAACARKTWFAVGCKSSPAWLAVHFQHRLALLIGQGDHRPLFAVADLHDRLRTVPRRRRVLAPLGPADLLFHHRQVDDVAGGSGNTSRPSRSLASRLRSSACMTAEMMYCSPPAISLATS